MTRFRYIIRHFPNLATHIYVEEQGNGETLVETRFSLFDSREYCLHNYEAAGYKVVFKSPEAFVEVGPWVTFKGGEKQRGNNHEKC